MNDDYFEDLDITEEDDLYLEDDYSENGYDEQELTSFDTEDVRDKEELTREFDRETDRQRPHPGCRRADGGAVGSAGKAGQP